MANATDVDTRGKVTAETRWADAQGMALLAREGWSRDSIVEAYVANDWSLLRSDK